MVKVQVVYNTRIKFVEVNTIGLEKANYSLMMRQNAQLLLNYGLLLNPTKNTITDLHNLIKNLGTLNTPRYSWRQWWHSSVDLIRQAIWDILYLVLANGNLRWLNLLLLLLLGVSRLYHRRFPDHTWIDTIRALYSLRFFRLMAKTGIPLLKKLVRVIVVRTQMLNLLKDFLHRGWRSRQFCVPITAIRTIWTKT